MKAFQALGVKIDFNESTKEVTIEGKGMGALTAPSEDIYLGNSGTGMRLLCGLFAGLPFDTTLTGDESLSSRPMKRVTEPLAKMGAKIDSSDGKAPLKIHGGSQLQAISHESKIASAQVKSCILLAGLNAQGTTVVSEPEKSRDHTERMMQSFGANLKVDGLKVSLEPGSKLIAKDIVVPGDISSAAFFMVAAAILDDAELKLKGVGINPSRTGIIDVLDAMKVSYKLENETEVNNEPIADIVVSSSKIQATTIEGDIIPRLIDEIPVISILAAQAEGTTVIKDAAELKVKESNRIASTVNMLKALGVKVEDTDDGMIIEGRVGQAFEPVEDSICADGDHRLAMSSAIAALKSNKPINIEQVEFVATSFPNFFDIIEAL